VWATNACFWTGFNALLLAVQVTGAGTVGNSTILRLQAPARGSAEDLALIANLKSRDKMARLFQEVAEFLQVVRYAI
jgi:hypothetical protein